MKNRILRIGKTTWALPGLPLVYNMKTHIKKGFFHSIIDSFKMVDIEQFSRKISDIIGTVGLGVWNDIHRLQGKINTVTY